MTCRGRPSGPAQPCGGGGVVESVAEPVGAQPSAALDEQEVGGPVQRGDAAAPAAGRVRRSIRRARQASRRRAGRCVRCRACRAALSASCRGWAESQTQSSSRSSSSPRRMPVPRSRVSPMRANGSGSLLTAAIRSRSMSGASARGNGLSSRGMSPGNSSRPGARSAQPQSGEVVEEAAQVDDGALADHRRHRPVTGDPAAPGPAVVVGEEVLDVVAGQLGQAAHLRDGGRPGTRRR